MPIRLHSSVGKMTSVLNYELAVAQEGFSNAQMMKFYNEAYLVTESAFGRYLDAKARLQPKTLHHVYEWNAVGDKRLWEIYRSSESPRGFTISYRFLKSKKKVPIDPILQVPGPNGMIVTKSRVFRNKAEVMESGRSVTMRSRGPWRMAYPTGRTLSGIGFSYGPLVVRNPGGPQTTYGFQKALSGYFGSGMAMRNLKSSGVLDRPVKRISRAGNNIPTSIRMAKFKGSMSMASVRGLAKSAIEAAG